VARARVAVDRARPGLIDRARPGLIRSPSQLETSAVVIDATGRVGRWRGLGLPDAQWAFRSAVKGTSCARILRIRCAHP
jgi:hypothetical protein